MVLQPAKERAASVGRFALLADRRLIRPLNLHGLGLALQLLEALRNRVGLGERAFARFPELRELAFQQAAEAAADVRHPFGDIAAPRDFGLDRLPLLAQ